MCTHNICFHGEIKKTQKKTKKTNAFWLEKVSYLELWPSDWNRTVSRKTYARV